MRLLCPECGGKTAIARRVIQSPVWVELYGQCGNVADCGAVAVHTLSVQRLLQPPALDLPALDTERLALAPAGRLFCPCCGGRARIEGRETQTPQVADLYCACRSGCGARFVATLAFDRYTQPPRGQVAQLAVSVIRGLPREERKLLAGQGDLWR